MKTMLAALILGAMALPAAAQEGGTETTDPRKAEVVNRLNTMRVSVDFTNQTLEDAIAFLRDFTGLNIVVDAEVYKNQSEDQLKITLKVKDLLLKSVLKLMLTSRELTLIACTSSRGIDGNCESRKPRWMRRAMLSSWSERARSRAWR